jgi:GAF domain-containing protein
VTHEGGNSGELADSTVSQSLAREIERAHGVAERVAEEVLRIGACDPRADRAGLLRLIHLSSGVEHRLFGLAARASLLDAERADEREMGMALSRQAAAIAQIATVLSEALTSDAVAATLATEAFAALRAHSVAVFVPSDAGDALEMVGSVNVSADMRARYARIPLDAELPVAAATAVVPFDAGMDRRGVLAISFDSPHTFDEMEQRFVVTLGQLCGQAMHRARLHDSARAERERAEAATDRLTRLQRVTGALCDTRTVADVAEVVIEEALAASGAFGGGVVVLSDDGQEFTTLRQSGIQTHLAEQYVCFPRSTPCMARDVLEVGPLFMNFEEYLEHYPTIVVWRTPPWTGARAAVPLRTERGPIGALTFMFAEAREFSEEDRAFLIALGDQCAIALERARLLQQG